jgi:hypothetical protein
MNNKVQESIKKYIRELFDSSMNEFSGEISDWDDYFGYVKLVSKKINMEINDINEKSLGLKADSFVMVDNWLCESLMYLVDILKICPNCTLLEIAEYVQEIGILTK